MADKEINFTLKADNIKITGLNLKDGQLELSLSAKFDSATLAQDLLAKLIADQQEKQAEPDILPVIQTGNAPRLQEKNDATNESQAIPASDTRETSEPEGTSGADQATITKTQKKSKPEEPEIQKEKTKPTPSPATTQQENKTMLKAADEKPVAPAGIAEPKEKNDRTSRYGEPESDIEWNAVLNSLRKKPEDETPAGSKDEQGAREDFEDRSDSAISLDKEQANQKHTHTKEPDYAEQTRQQEDENTTGKQLSVNETTEEPQQTEESEETTKPEQEPENPCEEPSSEPSTLTPENEAQKQADEQKIESNEDIKTVFSPETEVSDDQPHASPRESKNYDSGFFQELSPAVNSHLPDDLPPELGASPQETYQPEISNTPLPEAPKDSTKTRIKFVCPKCHTTGHQNIDRVGSVITCENCGRAMRLTLKK